MKTKIEDKLQTMPEAKIKKSKKDEMLYHVLNHKNEHRKKRRWTGAKEWLISTGGIGVAVVLALIIFVLPNQEPTEQAFVAEEDLLEIEELLSFDFFEVQLPTYVPFPVENVVYNTMYYGPIDLTKPEDNYYAEPDDPSHWQFSIIYEGENRDREFEVVISQSSFKYEDIDDFDEVVDFGDGKEGKFESRKMVERDWTKQFFAWQEGDILIEIGVMDQTGEPFSLEEVIKIAESFKVFNP